MKYSTYGYRINQLSKAPGYNWLFLPGGPGLGSEYLIDFCKQLKLPGTITLLDFPMDGTNSNGKLDFAHWREGLINLLKNYPDVILVTHSFSGMFALSMPEIENSLCGLILMNTTSMNSFFDHVSKMQQKHHLPDLIPAASAYHLHPSNESYREFWNTYKHYCFTPDEMQHGEEMMNLFAFNNASYHHAIQYFYPHYECKLHSSMLPIMTIASEYDFVCPPEIFIQDKRYQSKNVLNKIIAQAGHCPWITRMDAIQDAFDDFVKKIHI